MELVEAQIKAIEPYLIAKEPELWDQVKTLEDTSSWFLKPTKALAYVVTVINKVISFFRNLFTVVDIIWKVFVVGPIRIVLDTMKWADEWLVWILNILRRQQWKWGFKGDVMIRNNREMKKILWMIRGGVMLVAGLVVSFTILWVTIVYQTTIGPFINGGLGLLKSGVYWGGRLFGAMEAVFEALWNEFVVGPKKDQGSSSSNPSEALRKRGAIAFDDMVGGKKPPTTTSESSLSFLEFFSTTLQQSHGRTSSRQEHIHGFSTSLLQEEEHPSSEDTVTSFESFTTSIRKSYINNNGDAKDLDFLDHHDGEDDEEEDGGYVIQSQLDYHEKMGNEWEKLRSEYIDEFNEEDIVDKDDAMDFKKEQEDLKKEWEDIEQMKDEEEEKIEEEF